MLYPAVVKNFWTRINTKIERFVASETSHPSKNLIRIRRKLFELSAKFVKLPPPTTANGEDSFYKFLDSQFKPNRNQNPTICCQSHIKIRRQFFELSCF